MAIGKCAWCCTQLVRVMLFIFNFIFWALGGTLLALGIYLKIEFRSLNDISDDNFSLWTYVLIGVGATIFVISFLGCCGTLLESNNLLMTYFMLLILLVVAELGCGIWTYLNREKISTQLYDGLDNAVLEYNRTRGDGQSSVVRDAVDSIQSAFKCCGSNGRADYAPADPPQSCCPTTKNDLPDCRASTYFDKGCKAEISSSLKANLWVVGIIIGILLFLELVGTILSCHLRHYVVKQDIERWGAAYSHL